MQVRAKAEQNGTRTFWIDAGMKPDSNLTNLLAAAIQGGSGQSESGREICGWNGFCGFVVKQQQPLLFIIDEFDRLGMKLKEEEQGALRAFCQGNPHLALLFVTRWQPTQVVEEFPAEMSRITGICAHHSVSGLKKRSIRQLVKRVYDDLHLKGDPEEWVEGIWKRVGGYSVAVMALVRYLAAAATEDGVTQPLLVDDILEGTRLNVAALLDSYWWDLTPRSRMTLLGHERAVEEYDSELECDGLIDQGKVALPAFLCERGRQLGLSRSRNTDHPGLSYAMERLHDIHSLMANVDDALRLRREVSAFELTSEVLHYARAFRDFGTRQGCENFFNHIYKVVYEGVGRRSEKGRSWRFPTPLGEFYGTSQVVADVSDLRNFFDHNCATPRDTERRNSDFVEASAIFERRCGVCEPVRIEEWSSLCASVLDDLVDLLKEIFEKVRALPSVSTGPPIG
jgi:hypothetical protein